MAENVELNKELPLAGAVLCCTSIIPEQRSELVATAAQMGALHKFDLTTEVTHLIVGEINTLKYKYVAKERSDIKVLRPGWVEAVRSSWVLGGDTDISALEEEYRLPTFSGLSICLTGFEDMEFRNHLQMRVNAHGAEFKRDLTKNVTHLIARTAEGQKYKFAMQWNINVVSLKWLEESIERGMILDETLYDPLFPSDKQGVGAWNRTVSVAPDKRVRPQELGRQRSRKLRRVASTKLGGQTEGIWSDIVGKDPVTSRDNGEQYEGSSGPFPSSNNRRPIIQESKSFASETTIPDRLGSVTQETQPVRLQNIEDQSRGFWYKSKFYITGFTSSQTRILESHLYAHGANLAPSLDDLLGHDNSHRTFVLVPFNLQRQHVPSFDDIEDEPELVTDMWIERCLHSNDFVPPEAHITSTPFPKFPIPAFQGMKICSTGFTGIDLLHLSKLVKLLGATYDEYLTSSASVLICNNTNPNSEKLRHVHEWNIPSVIADWLWISVQTGEKKPYQPYLIPYTRSLHHAGQEVSGAAVTANPVETSRPDKVGQEQGATQNITSQENKDHDKSKAATIGEALGSQPTTTFEGASENSPQKHSRSSSPKKDHINPPVPTTTLLEQNYNPKSTTNDASAKTPLDLAIGELLKQKQKRSRSKPSSISEKEDQPRQQRRRQLFGRANSYSSTFAPNDKQRGASRASSIDTLNEDGCGSIVDGLYSPSTKAPSNAPSFVTTQPKVNNNNLDRTEAQLMLQRRLTLFQNNSAHGEFAETKFDDDEAPEFTQLGYEDPDAVAMRERITKRTQSEEADDEKQSASGAGRKLVIGKLQDNRGSSEWANRRRTRSGKQHD